LNGWNTTLGRLSVLIAIAMVVQIAIHRFGTSRMPAPGTTSWGQIHLFAGFAAFALGARHGLAISAVLSSQFATLATVAGLILFRERLGRVQVVGVAALAGAAVLDLAPQQEQTGVLAGGEVIGLEADEGHVVLAGAGGVLSLVHQRGLSGSNWTERG
jgi:drug/metabolite transporter (DMT)-like permease